MELASDHANRQGALARRDAELEVQRPHLIELVEH
jgi:hypothetical protein